MEATVEFDKVLLLAKHEASDSTPSSVHLRYQARLTALRSTLRKQSHVVPLGSILVSIGVTTDQQLNQALQLQNQSIPRKLLGEILIDTESVDRDTLAHALAIQSKAASMIATRRKTPTEVCGA